MSVLVFSHQWYLRLRSFFLNSPNRYLKKKLVRRRNKRKETKVKLSIANRAQIDIQITFIHYVFDSTVLSLYCDGLTKDCIEKGVSVKRVLLQGPMSTFGMLTVFQFLVFFFLNYETVNCISSGGPILW